MHVLSIYLQRSIDTTNSTEEVIECELIKQLECVGAINYNVVNLTSKATARILGLGLDP